MSPGMSSFILMSKYVPAAQLQRYRAAVDEINRRTAAGAAEGQFVDHDELLRRSTQNLMAAVSSLPELQEQKKVRHRKGCLTQSSLPT